MWTQRSSHRTLCSEWLTLCSRWLQSSSHHVKYFLFLLHNNCFSEGIVLNSLFLKTLNVTFTVSFYRLKLEKLFMSVLVFFLHCVVFLVIGKKCTGFWITVSSNVWMITIFCQVSILSLLLLCRVTHNSGNNCFHPVLMSRFLGRILIFLKLRAKSITSPQSSETGTWCQMDSLFERYIFSQWGNCTTL